MNIGENIKKRRLELGISVDELAEKIGKNRATIYRYENSSIENLPTTILEPLAKALYTTPAKLMGWSNAKEINIKTQTRRIPILGKIAAGTPILAVENHENYFDTSEFINADFALQIQGDSMIGSRIYDGDIVFLKKQSCIENGQIGAFLIDGEATLKIFNKQNNTIMLLSSNPQYQPIILSPEKENLILGKLIGVYSRR